MGVHGVRVERACGATKRVLSRPLASHRYPIAHNMGSLLTRVGHGDVGDLVGAQEDLQRDERAG